MTTKKVGRVTQARDFDAACRLRVARLAGCSTATAIPAAFASRRIIERSQLVNVSARTQVSGGDNTLIAGFVIGGTTARTVLIRAAGPVLAGRTVCSRVSFAPSP